MVLDLRDLNVQKGIVRKKEIKEEKRNVIVIPTDVKRRDIKVIDIKDVTVNLVPSITDRKMLGTSTAGNGNKMTKIVNLATLKMLIVFEMRDTRSAKAHNNKRDFLTSKVFGTKVEKIMENH